MQRIKNRICQNLSKFEKEFVGYPTSIVVEGISISPSPFFYLAYRNTCNYLSQKCYNTVGKSYKFINGNMKPLQDTSSCQKWLFWWFWWFFGGAQKSNSFPICR